MSDDRLDVNNIQDEHLRIAIDKMTDGVYIVDDKRRLIFWSKGAEDITGYKSEEVLNTFCFDNILRHIDDKGTMLCRDGCPLHKTMQDGLPRENKVYLHHKSGLRVPVTVRVAPLYNNGDRQIIGAVETFTRNYSEDELNRRIKELEEVALLDQLTRISNRHHLDIKLHTIHMELLRYGWNYGIILIDVDHFKHVNDKYGHNAGDKVLKMIANLLSQNMRPFDTVGRWGGEEFLIIASNVNSNQLFGLAERLRMLTENSAIYIDGNPVKVTISVGITAAVREDSPETLLKRADDLLYQSKSNGRNRVTQ